MRGFNLNMRGFNLNMYRWQWFGWGGELGEGQRPFGNFPKIHPFSCGQPSLKDIYLLACFLTKQNKISQLPKQSLIPFASCFVEGDWSSHCTIYNDFVKTFSFSPQVFEIDSLLTCSPLSLSHCPPTF